MEKSIKTYLKSTLLIAGVVLMCISACKKDPHVSILEKDYIIIGYGNGFCASNCEVTYLINKDGVFRSVNYLQTKKLSSFNQKLSEEKFKQVKDFETKIPEELINSGKDEVTFIGCPNCADQGSYYVEIVIKGKNPKCYFIDTITDELPDYLKKFAIDINGTLGILK
ncbi:MAG: hypothetical protein WBP45_08480 [Daejeonella sp.]